MPRKPAKHPAKPKRGKKLEVEEPGVLYGRYSSHNQKDISVEQQFEKGYELAAEYGIRIIDTYADRAVSGRTDKRRDFQRMMTDAAKGKFRYVIAWKSNRMGRNMLEALINEARLQDLGVRVLYVEEDFDDTAAGRFAARSMMNVNQFYSENMAEDIKRGLYDNAANCMVANGHLPYGYKADETLHYAIDEPKAAVIREIFTRVSCGEAFVDIMASLNARGIKTSYGRPWGRSSFQKILSNERYRGIYIYGDVRKEGGIPRIVSDELYFKVQEVITTKKNPQGRHRINGDYLLTGKLFCGHCKSPMTGISGTSRSGNLHYYYVCQKRRTEKTCEKKNLRRDDIELQVAKAIKRRTLDDDTINWIADSVVEYSQHQESASGIGLLEDQLKDTQRSIKNLMAAIEQGIITPTTKTRLMELEKEQSDIDRKITMAKADVIPVNRDQLVGWLKKLQAGDVHDKKYQAELFDTFLIAVYVYDNPDGQDYMKVVFNYAGSKNTVEIPLDPSVIDNVENIETGAVRLSSAQVHQMDMTRTPAFSKAVLPCWCDCDVKTKDRDQGMYALVPVFCLFRNHFSQRILRTTGYHFQLGKIDVPGIRRMIVVFKVVYFVNLESDRVAHLAPGLFLIPICQPMVFPGNRFLFQERGGQETVNLVKVIPSKAIVKYAFDVRHIKILPKTDRGSLLGQMVRGII